MIKSENDLYWLAGLIEGEGSFLKAHPSSPTSPGIAIQMSDEDVIEKVAKMFNRAYNKWYPPEYKNKGWKPIFITKLRGREAVIVMKKLHPLMGHRKQKKIDEILDNYKPVKRIKMSEEEVITIKKMLKEENMTQTEIANTMNCRRETIVRINTGKYHKDIKIE